MTLATQPPYPVVFEVEYPEQQSRWKALLRVFLALPVLIFAGILVGSSGFADAGDRQGQVAIGAAGSVILAIWITIVLRQRIPAWLFDFWVAVQRFCARALAYLVLLTDQYPPFEGEHAVRYEVRYPEKLSRWRVFLWKFITAIPHFIVVTLLAATLIVVVPIAWFAILFSGRFPKGLHDYVAGVLRWGARVYAYAISLTDEFPPFSLSADAGPGGRESYAICSVIGVLAVLAAIGGGITAFVLGEQEETVSVSYGDLLSGEVERSETLLTSRGIEVAIDGASDPADELFPFLEPEQAHRFVHFELTVANDRDDNRDLKLRASDFGLQDTGGDDHDPQLVVVNGRMPPEAIEAGETATVDLLFELEDGEGPAELRYDPENFFLKSFVYEFE